MSTGCLDMNSASSRPEPHKVSLADKIKRLENEFLFQNTFSDFRKIEFIQELKIYSQMIECQSMSHYKSIILEDLKRRTQVLMEAVKKVDTVETSGEALGRFLRKGESGSPSPYGDHQHHAINPIIQSLQRKSKDVNESLDKSLAVSSIEEPGSKQYLEKLGVIRGFLLILREEIRYVIPMNLPEEMAVEELKSNCDDNLEKIDFNIRKLNFENCIFSARKCLSDPVNRNELGLGKLKAYVEKLDPYDDETRGVTLGLLEDIDEHISRLNDTLYQTAALANLIFNNIDLMVPEEAMAYFDTASKISTIMESIHSTQYCTNSDLFQTQTDALQAMHNHVKNLNLWGKNVCTVHQIKEGVEYFEDLLHHFNTPFAEIFSQRLRTKISQIDQSSLPGPLRRQFNEDLQRFYKANRELPAVKIEHDNRLVRYAATLKEVEKNLSVLEPEVLTFKGIKCDANCVALNDKLANNLSELEDIEIYDGEIDNRKEALCTRLEELIQTLDDRTLEFEVLSSLEKDIFNLTVLLNNTNKGCIVELKKAKHEFYEISDKLYNIQSGMNIKHFPDWMKSITETYNIYEKDYPDIQKTLSDEETPQQEDFDQDEFEFIFEN